MDRARRYYLALGVFVDHFAHIEACLRIVMWQYAKISRKKAKILLSGAARIDTVCDLLGRLKNVGMIPPEKWHDLSPLIDRIRQINERRNLILHHGASGVGTTRMATSDARLALTPERVKRFPISANALGGLAKDLIKIKIHLMSNHMGQPHRPGSLPTIDRVLSAPWQDMPQLEPIRKSPTPGKKDHAKDRVRKSRQKTFPE